MAIEIKPEAIKEIAEYLEAGMVCFYHKTTGEIEYYPDELRNGGFDEEVWADVIAKVEENDNEYLHFEGMHSSEAFRVMESFIDNINHIPTRDRFIDEISLKKPFSRFNNLLHYYPDLREQWFAYKLEAYMEHVKEQQPFDAVD